MQKLFTTYPGGQAGAGLLLLRGVIGVTTILQAAGPLMSSGLSVAQPAVVGLFYCAAGALLLFGLLTRVSSLSMAILLGLGALDLLPLHPAGPYITGLSALLALAICASLCLLGPGAYSMDAKRHGRREIIIS